MSFLIYKEFIHLRYYDKSEPNPKDRRKQFSTEIPNDRNGRRLAKEYQKRFDTGLLEKEILHLRGVNTKRTTLYFTEAFAEFISKSKRKINKPLTYSSELAYIQTKNLFLEFAGDKPLSEYTQRHYIKFVEFLDKRTFQVNKKKDSELILRKMSPSTIAKHTRQLKAMFNYFFQHIENLDRFIIETRKPPKGNPISIPPDAIKAILLESKNRSEFPHQYYFIMFALLTGARASSVLAQTWDNVFLDHGYIKIYNVKTKQFYPFPLSDELLELLKTLRGSCNKLGRLFPQYSTHRSTPVFWIRLIKRLVRDHKIEHAYTFHQLRKTFATWVANSGADRSIVKDLLDHSSVQITDEFYTENNMQIFKKAVDKVHFG
jgi:integrase